MKSRQRLCRVNFINPLIRSCEDKVTMSKLAIQMSLTLKYQKDGGWFVGQLVEEPEVVSQGTTLAELQANIRDAYALVLSERKRKRSRQSSRTSKSRQVCVTA